jgi:MFS family permease
MVDGLFGVVILALIALLVHDNESKTIHVQSSNKEFITGLKKCFVNLQNIACGLYISFMNMPLMIIGAVYGSLFLTQTHGISLVESSFVISMICVGTIIGSPIFGHLGDYLGHKKLLMAAGSICSTIIFLTIMYIGPSQIWTLIALFTLLGIFTSSQVLGYPLITQYADKELTGTSTSVAAVIIMGLPMLLGPLAGRLMDLHSYLNADTKETIFPVESFHSAFLIFPIGFILALSLLSSIKEKKAIYNPIN